MQSCSLSEVCKWYCMFMLGTAANGIAWNLDSCYLPLNTSNALLIANGVRWNKSIIYSENRLKIKIFHEFKNSKCTMTSIYTLDKSRAVLCILCQELPVWLQMCTGLPWTQNKTSLHLQYHSGSDLWEQTSTSTQTTATLDSCEGQLSDWLTKLCSCRFTNTIKQLANNSLANRACSIWWHLIWTESQQRICLDLM